MRKFEIILHKILISLTDHVTEGENAIGDEDLLYIALAA